MMFGVFEALQLFTEVKGSENERCSVVFYVESDQNAAKSIRTNHFNDT